MTNDTKRWRKNFPIVIDKLKSLNRDVITACRALPNKIADKWIRSAKNWQNLGVFCEVDYIKTQHDGLCGEFENNFRGFW